MESFFHRLSGSTFIFVNKTHQKAANLMFGLILPVALTPAWFLGGHYKLNLGILIQYKKRYNSETIYFYERRNQEIPATDYLVSAAVQYHNYSQFIYSPLKSRAPVFLNSAICYYANKGKF